MKHNTRTLEGPMLDLAVARAQGRRGAMEHFHFKTFAIHSDACRAHAEGTAWSPSTDPAIGQRIIEREGIEIHAKRYDSGKRRCWVAVAHEAAGIYSGLDIEGPTPLIAAMRAYVASRFGDEVDLPS